MSLSSNFKRMRALQLTVEPNCHYCGAPAATVDHIISKACGGRDVHWNLVSACRDCNVGKGPKWPDCSCDRCRAAEAAFVTGSHPEDARPKGPTRKTFGSRAYWRAVERGYEPEIEGAREAIW